MKISLEVQRAFERTVRDYPRELDWLIRANRTRLLWQIETVVRNVPRGGRIIDIGGGIVPFMLTCKCLGYKPIVVDDFADAGYQNEATKKVLQLFDEGGVTVITGDVLTTTEFGDADKDFSLVTSHDSMEHWHNSPKPLFHRLWERLDTEGLLWLGVPNCVNLRKRLTVPFGIGKWSSMRDWYEQEVFRGHVREPDVDDLRYIARDLGARRIKVAGKNWLGYRNSRKLVRAVTPFVDQALQFMPSICSDIYLLAWK